MDALVGLRAVYDNRAAATENALATLSQRVRIDEAQARAAERPLMEFRATVDDFCADVDGSLAMVTSESWRQCVRRGSASRA